MGEQKDRMLAGQPYLGSDPELTEDHCRAVDLTDAFNRSGVRESALRRELLTELLGEFGDDSTIRAPFHVDYGYNITIGPRTFVNFGAVMLDVGTIAIGADVQIGPYVQLLTATHPIEIEPRRAKWESSEPIRIGDNVWLGGGVVVCPGVTIGANTVVAAGAVVASDLPEGVVAAGVPARVVRAIEPGDG